MHFGFAPSLRPRAQQYVRLIPGGAKKCDMTGNKDRADGPINTEDMSN